MSVSERPEGAEAIERLCEGINNLRGYRVAEQGPFLAHVDAIERQVFELSRAGLLVSGQKRGLPDEDVEHALGRYFEAYHREFPQGGDAGDHDNAHREGIVAVLAGPAPARNDGGEDEVERLRAAIRSIQERYERREQLHTSDFTAAITGGGVTSA